MSDNSRTINKKEGGMKVNKENKNKCNLLVFLFGK